MLYLKRKIDAFLAAWKENPDRKPLIVKGPRQVGKTESIRRFGDRNYKYDECCRAIKCESLPCHGCDWWNKEYVEPEKKRE